MQDEGVGCCAAMSMLAAVLWYLPCTRSALGDCMQVIIARRQPVGTLCWLQLVLAMQHLC